MPTYFKLDTDLGPFVVPVMIQERLSERLEVPPEWQFAESFASRVRTVLDVAADAMKHSEPNKPVRFSVIVSDNMTRMPETLDLVLRYDGEDYLLGFR